jgi:2-oxo-4-hydroxy-4-carboxy-5-ureidoimidazoline decarboxylase
VSVAVKELDAMPPDQARGLLAECCGSSKWVNEMVAKRPFRSREKVFKAAEEVADTLDPNDWLEAFAHHPRIGEKPAATTGIDVGAKWATAEQAGMETAGSYAKIALARANQEYERRFGYIYIVCATGKSADEMIEILHQRLTNDPEKELRVAAGEQRKITRLRLEKLLENDKGGEKR